MKIIDIQRFINNFKLILEDGVTLPNIRQGILGKKGKREYPVIDDDKEWYEEHKDEVLKTIEKVLNVEDKTLKIKLQKFDLEDFFTTDKPRKLKVRKMLKAVKRNFISQVERSKMTEDKTSGIEAQYEMMEMGNGVEVYAVYTPMANRHLTHTKLWVLGCFSPTWCIASSTANNYWNHYHLYDAEYPSVFIVAQKTKTGYNKEKYELKCDPYKSSQFKNGKNGEITLGEWVDEWRNPEQNEGSYNNSSLFKNFNISLEELENTIRKLVNSKKSSTFSKKYGKEMLNLYTEKIYSKDKDTRMEYLTKACKNGTFINFCDKIDREDKDYYLDELIRYDTLTEAEVEAMNIRNNNKALSNLIKNKRCTHKSLEWANRYFDKNMVRKVYHSLPDDVLSLETIEGFNVREEIFENIKKDKGLTEEFLNYQIKNGIVNNTSLKYVSHDEALLKKCLEIMIKNDKVNNYTLNSASHDIELLKKCVDYLIENDKVDNKTLEMLKYYKELLEMCVEFLIKNGKVDYGTLSCVEDDKELLRKCVEFLIENDGVDNGTLRYVENDKELLRMCVEILIKNNEVHNATLNSVMYDEELLKKCVEIMIKNNEVNSFTLDYVKYNKQLFEKCLEFVIKNGKVNSDTLKYVKYDKELLKKCIEISIKNDRVDDYTLDYVKYDKELLKKCVENMIKNNRVDEWTLKYVQNDKELLRKCVDYLISRNKYTSLDILKTARYDEESLRKSVEYFISKNKITNEVIKYVKRDEELMRKCVDYLISKNELNNNVLEYVYHDEELLRKCVEYLISKNRIYNRTLDYVPSDGDLMRKCVDNLISNNDVDNDTLKYVRRDEESLRKCVEYLISKNKIDKKTLSELFSWDDNTSMIKKVLIYLIDKNREFEIYRTIENGKKFYEKDITTLCKILDEREMNDVLRGLLSHEYPYDNYYIRLYEEILERCSSSTKMISCSMLFGREKCLRINEALNTTFKKSKDDESILENLVKCFISSGYKSYFDKALNDDYEGRYALYYVINNLENDYKEKYFEKCIENIEKFENTYEDFVSFLKQNKEYSERAERWLGYPLFGETEEKDKITQMKNLYRSFDRKYKENGYKSNEEIKNIIREMLNIGFYKRNKKSYAPIVALIRDVDIPEDSVKMVEEILKQIGEENYNVSLLNYMTWNKKFYKFIPHMVDALISKNDIGTSLMEIIKKGEVIDVNSAKKLANWIIKNKNTIDKDTKASVNYIKEKYPEIYEELFGDKL